MRGQPSLHSSWSDTPCVPQFPLLPCSAKGKLQPNQTVVLLVSGQNPSCCSVDFGMQFSFLEVLRGWLHPWGAGNTFPPLSVTAQLQTQVSEPAMTQG